MKYAVVNVEGETIEEIIVGVYDTFEEARAVEELSLIGYSVNANIIEFSLGTEEIILAWIEDIEIAKDNLRSKLSSVPGIRRGG